MSAANDVRSGSAGVTAAAISSSNRLVLRRPILSAGSSRSPRNSNRRRLSKVGAADVADGGAVAATDRARRQEPRPRPSPSNSSRSGVHPDPSARVAARRASRSRRTVAAAKCASRTGPAAKASSRSDGGGSGDGGVAAADAKADRLLRLEASNQTLASDTFDSVGGSGRCCARR